MTQEEELNGGGDPRQEAAGIRQWLSHSKACAHPLGSLEKEQERKIVFQCLVT